MRMILFILIGILLSSLTVNSINEVFPVNESLCGDQRCGAGEDPFNCPEDCYVNRDTLITCLFQDAQQECNWHQSWFPPIVLAAILIIIIARSLYKNNRKH